MQAEKLRKQKLKLYEQYADGDMPKEAYQQSKAAIDGSLAALEADSAAMQDRVSELEELATPLSSSFAKTCRTYENETALSHELAHAFVEAVIVFPDGHREISWKFRDIQYETAQDDGAAM